MKKGNSIKDKQTALRILAALLILVFFATASMALKRGDSGDQVKTLQKKLINWGYLNDTADGKFGGKTETAVKSFQKKNGLPQTGVVDDATAKSLGMTLGGGSSGGGNNQYKPSQGNSNNSDVQLLARCIYGEGRGEPYQGKVAIGAVVLNRVDSSEFPNTIAGVIYQPGAFSIVADGQINLTPNEECLRAAKDAMNGSDPTGGCVFYFNPKKTSNKYMHSKELVVTIGAHNFVR